jgi:hypothetical protein
MRNTALFTALAASVLLTACSIERASNVVAPSGASSAPAATASSLLGMWSSQAVAPTASGCTNFQWVVSSQTPAALAGTFSASCAGGLEIQGSASGQLGNLTSIPIAVNGTASIPGVPNCAFALTGSGSVDPGGTILTIPYSGTTCQGPVHGTQVLRKSTPAPVVPTPTPPPPPPPAPAPTPVPSGPSDGMNLGLAAVYNSPGDIASWPIRSTITQLDMSSAGLSFQFSTQNSWPDVVPPGFSGPLQYTVWAVVNINGQWNTSGFIQMWRGRVSTGAPILTDFATNWAYDSRWGPMDGYHPHVGELMGFFLSAGDARGESGVSSVRERTQVVMVSLPAGDSGSFSFSAGSLPLVKGR